MAQDRPRLVDVARRAGVSSGAASKILNGKGSFAEATRERVLRVAQELQFAPNGLIRALQTGQTKTVGVFFWPVGSTPMRGIALPLLQGIAAGIAGIGRDMLLYSDLAGRFDNGSVSAFLDRRVDGLIVVPSPQSFAALKNLGASGLPTVVLYWDPLPGVLGVVDIDYVGGAMAAIGHLSSLGHRRIAFDGALRNANNAALAQAYIQAMDHCGVPIAPELFVAPAEGRLPVGEAVERLIGLPDPPTAVFVDGDPRAFEWLGELHRRGLRVPQDLSLVGFDDAPGADIPPGLTTVRQPVLDVGLTAARLLQRLITGSPASECRAVLPVELVVRGSTAPSACR